ncbi:MAG: 16S rRNA (uracil(1498)-N(3))-methyltransferase [Chromatocurvus sp.]
MQRPRFFTRQALATGQHVVLEDEAARHIGRTLRMQPGDTLVLFDGSGAEYPGALISVDKRSVTVHCSAPQNIDREPPLAVELGIAVSRGDRVDWVVQKATELGVARIAPLFTARGVNLVADRREKKRGHWRRIAESACEQCGRNRIPDIAGPQSLADWLDAVDAPLRLVLDPRAEAQALPDHAAAVALLCGPEGGLEEEEVTRARATGFGTLALGPRILRTETAPLAALAVLQARWGDLRF